MEFQYKTEQGVSLEGSVGYMPNGEYLVVFHEETLSFTEQIVFSFRATCGHPALTREYVNEVNYKEMKIKEVSMETIIPKRILTAELPGLRTAAAKMVAEAIEYCEEHVVVEPSEKFKKAMHQLMQINKNPSLLNNHVPAHLRDFMHHQFETLLDFLRQAPNAYRGDQMADKALAAIEHYNITFEEPCSARLTIN